MTKKNKIIIFMIILTILSSFLFADYQPQGYNSIVFKARSPIKNNIVSDVMANTAFSFGGYLDFGWIFYVEDLLNTYDYGMALSIKGIIVSQSDSNPLNVELSGHYGFINSQSFFSFESSYYHIFDSSILKFKLGSLFRYASREAANYSELYGGGLVGLVLKISSNMLLGFDTRILTDNSLELIIEPEFILSIHLSE